MRHKYLILIFICLIACSSPSPEMQFRKERDKIISQVLRNFTKLIKDKGLTPIGIGEGIDHSNEKQNFLKVVFYIKTLPDINFARKVVVDTLQEFLDTINSTEGIQDYLVEYPFPIRCINIGIISQNEGSGLFSVSNFKEELNYRKHDQSVKGPCKEIHTELYEDAVSILASEKST